MGTMKFSDQSKADAYAESAAKRGDLIVLKFSDSDAFYVRTWDRK